MRKTMMIGLIVAVAATACGGAGDAGDGDGTADEAPDAGVTSPETPPVSPANESEDQSGVPSTTSSTTPGTVPGELETIPPVAKAEVGTTIASPGTSTTPPQVDHPNALVATALSDLVSRVSVDPDAITVVSIEEVTWPDGSYGCPQPDMSYTQALVNGTRIVLRVDGVDYEYHSGGRREPFYCQNPAKPAADGFGDV